MRNHPDIGDETRARVLRRVQELDYKPNLLAQSLVTGRSYLLGLIVPDLLHPFFAEVAKSLSTAIRAQGYSVIIASSEEDPAFEATEIEHMMSRQLDAIVIASCSPNAGVLERIDRKQQPYVLIDREFPGTTSNFVGVDDEAVGRLATQHLIDQGTRRIAHIRGGENSTGIGRFEGYRNALLRNGLLFLDNLVVTPRVVDVESEQHGADAMIMLLDQRPRPDAVFCYNDPLAIGAMKSILDFRLEIPKDIAVVGCGNLHYDSSLSVPLSSIDQRSQLIGERTATILVDTLSSKTRPTPIRVILDPELVVRASSVKTNHLRKRRFKL